MFSISSLFSTALPWSSKAATQQVIKLDPVEPHNYETKTGKRDRTLKHLIRLNHVNHAVLFHNLQYHNHMPHILGSAYLLHANEQHLERIFEVESEELDKWRDSPGEISRHDWRDYLGNRQYQRAYLDFFEDELVVNGYDWRVVLNKYLLEGDKPLINCLVAGLGHPLIHLGYAFELSSRDLAMEALTLGATCYNFLHKYLDDPSYSKASSSPTTSLLEILERLANDSRFEAVDGQLGSDTSDLFRDHEQLLLEYWNMWDLKLPTKQFKESQLVASLLVAATQKAGDRSYNFFLVHILTTSHAVRIILPLVPGKFHVPLVRQWWLLTLVVYITQLRPKIHKEYAIDYDIGDKGWSWVKSRAIQGEWATDAHFVKALRALEQASDTWGDDEGYFLKCAVKLGERFSGWSGAGSASEAYY